MLSKERAQNGVSLLKASRKHSNIEKKGKNKKTKKQLGIPRNSYRSVGITWLCMDVL
jgi:hypothetical protein